MVRVLDCLFSEFQSVANEVLFLVNVLLVFGPPKTEGGAILSIGFGCLAPSLQDNLG